MRFDDVAAAFRAEVSAVEYYRPDDRFSAGTNARRINLAQQRAASVANRKALAGEFDRTWRRVIELCAQEPPGRVVRTRHGDAMLLTDFLTTRIVEVGIHGLDLAVALDHEPWLTAPAARVLTELLLGDPERKALSQLGWDDLTFLRKATGRARLTEPEARHVEQSGVRWLSLG